MSYKCFIGGKLIETTGGNDICYAEESIVLNCLKPINICGDKNGVTLNKPKSYKPKTDLKIIKVEGPFDQNDKLIEKIGFERYYTYKATPNRKPILHEVAMLKWAIQSDKGTIKELKGLSSVNQLNKEGKIIINIAINQDCEKARIYAYYKNANVDASVVANIIEPLIIFVNGYWNKDLPYAGTDIGKNYWGGRLKDAAKNHFGTNKELFINGSGTNFSSGKERYNDGLKLANDRLKNKSSKFYIEIFKTKRKIIIVSHSMGAAYSEGILEVLKKENVKIQKVIHFSSADNSDFNVNFPNLTYQIDIDWDPVLTYKNLNDVPKIKNILFAGLVKNPKNDKFGHMYTKEEAFVFNWFKDLEKLNLQFIRDDTRYVRMPSDGMGPSTTTKIKIKKYTATNLIHNTQFKNIYKDGALYHGSTNNEYEKYI